ncbi:fibrillin-2-like isoform X3 [Scylla paramamosain]|uniref:fibrillin-2-like isoform X3 n=1 Tax=Scylla paramamosain TaxID=85552 RepID=UPI003082EEF0
MNFVKNQSRLLVVILLLILATVTGDLAPTFGICCAYGANWARESQQCSAFPTPINELPTEHQSICVTAAGICCLRYFRNEQCQKGSQAAQLGHDCLPSSSQGGEYFKDCCQACKLGIFSGGMGMGCGTRFKFGFPWDNAYHDCCNQATSSNLSPNLPGNQVIDNENLYPGVPSSPSGIPDPENLCEQLSGKLCSDFCVPTPGSYRCMCRPGFTLSRDGKTCIQDAVNNRCEENNPCDHICMDTGVSIVCSCNPGFILEADQKSCEDINECSSGVHGCVAVEQVCYNLVGSYVCINADGSFSAPGPTPIQPGSPSGLPADSRITAFDKNEVVQGRNPLIRGGHGTLGVQGFPGASPEPGLSGFSQSHGRCPPGYSFNLDSQACDDVDECQVTSGLCVRGTICQNTIGSYTCTHMPVVDCPSGFAFDLNLQSCLDVDECEDGSHNCNWTTHLCVNNQGGYMCQEKSGSSECVAGYKFSTQQQKCIDVDECAEELHGCHPEEETCRNTDGAYECDIACQEGFQFSLVLRTCVDQDECVDAPCEPGWECRNTVGSYLCHELPRAFCPAGYKPSNGSASGCEDVDECVEGLHSCHAVRELCINEIGKYRCEAIIHNEVNREGSQFRNVPHAAFQPHVEECPEGYGFDLTSRQCLDIDECNVGFDDCSQAEKCINTLGSYVCQPHVRCTAGFAPDSLTGECKDVDECAAGIGNCLPGQICFNTIGAFECRVECQDGFIYDPTDAAVCVDVNECLLSPCGFGEDCHNTEGSYICIASNSATSSIFTTSSTSTTTTTRPPATCLPGFKRNPKTLQCEDVDECEEGLHNCQVGHEQCVNTYGGHDCRSRPCSPGFVRDPHDPSLCKDVNECESSPCEAEEKCVNTNGSYSCRRRLTPCTPGFRRNERNEECEDIDECVEEAPCSSEERCINTHGSYKCRSVQCPPGYQRNIWGQCRDVNECETGEHTCNIPKEQCVNSIGSFRCKPLPDCPQGFTRHPTSLRCVDVDECVEGTHDCMDGEQCFNQYGQYDCRASPNSCSRGFRYNSRDRRCKDIDECTENSDSCDRETQTCINSQGSFRCIDRKPICDFGYRYNEELQSCVDIDECTEDTHDCSSVETCVNHLGHYTCQHRSVDGDSLNSTAYNKENNEDVSDYEVVLAKRPGDGGNKRSRCSAGYRYNRRRRTCVDIDECEENRDFCNKLTERCVNNEGNYWCSLILDLPVPSSKHITTSSTTTTLKPPPLPSLPPKPDHLTPQCPLGTEYNHLTKACVDIDECATNPCKAFEVCENSQGSYQCQCLAGYSREEPDGDCEDMNECQLDLHTCTSTQRCDNTVGSYACIRIAGCGTGYTLNHNTGECDDIDECIEDNPCRQNERCTNTLGSYKCQPRLNCYAGFEMNEAGTQCVDIDECAKGTHQCVGNQLCSNRQGSYICYCPQGFRRNTQQQCEDINECESYRGRVCANNADCENTEGSFICKCKAGFKQAANGLSCIDVDECEETPEICQHNCINVWGTYYCTCNAGHILNSDNRTCSDVDECENARNRGHLCIGLCVNVPGSFKCTCPDGYTLAADGRTCKDINECETSNVCRGIGEQCVNTQGGYKCNTITCPDNYVRDSRHKNRCERLASHCQLGDDACRLKPLSYSYNYLPLVSNLTLPSVGEVNIFTMRGPLWSTTTVQFELELEYVETSPEVQPVTRDYFRLKRTAYNQAVISLVKSIIGPQEIQLSLNMKLYQQGRYSGSAVAKLLLYVSEYTF